MTTNLELAKILREIADLLDLQGEKFKPEAYRRASRSIESLAEDARKVADRGELDTIPGVGEAIAEKIREYLRTGSISYFERLRRELPPGIVEIMHLPGLGPKTARRFLVELNIEGPAELEEAIAAGRLDSMKGFGPRKIELFREALKARGSVGQRTALADAWRIAESIVASLRKGSTVDKVEAAGSLRRRRESVGDLDILVTSSDPERVFEAFSSLPGVKAVKLRGGTKETVEWEGGIQVDLRVVEPSAFGAALQYFTGSKDHNVHLRSIARDRGLKVNEYGVFRGDVSIASATEEEVYASLGLPWIPPEIRENQGEIEAAARHALPALIAESDLKGVLHVHLSGETPPGDLERLLDSASHRGFGYLGLVRSSMPGQSLAESTSGKFAEAVATLRSRPKAAGAALFLGAEMEIDGQFAMDQLGEGWDYWVGRPSASSALHPDSIPVDVLDRTPPLLLAHLSGPAGSSGLPADRQGAWVKLAAAWTTSLDLNAGEGLDSSGAKSAASSLVPLHLGPTGQTGDPFHALGLGVGLARRGWVGPTSVLNARAATELRLARSVSSGGPKRARRAAAGNG
ncbi:MAG: helix-hairpin-helix domain-containing protein [Thermoplasmata archaeon]|nr:helix-hairpin-helix domain-containing protein [Thermoplasmata archaeon]